MFDFELKWNRFNSESLGTRQEQVQQITRRKGKSKSNKGVGNLPIIIGKNNRWEKRQALESQFQKLRAPSRSSRNLAQISAAISVLR